MVEVARLAEVVRCKLARMCHVPKRRLLVAVRDIIIQPIPVSKGIVPHRVHIRFPSNTRCSTIPTEPLEGFSKTTPLKEIIHT